MDGGQLWEFILQQLADEGLELPTRTGLWFHAQARGQAIRIGPARDKTPGSRLSKPRTVHRGNFLALYPIFPRWDAGEPGLSREVQRLSQNSAYIFALIRHFQNGTQEQPPRLLKHADPVEIHGILDGFYTAVDEDSRLLSRPGQVEYLTTMHYIGRYLRPGMRVIEIGAGTGRYSHALADMGCRVDAVELLARNIRVFERNTRPGAAVTITQGNATDLSAFPDDAYDLTLLLGPMYHLFEQADKEKALSEALRVTRPGGILFVAYCMSDASLVAAGFRRGMMSGFIEKGNVDLETFATFPDPGEVFELYRKEGIEALRGTLDAAPLHFLAADGYAHHMRQELMEMDEAMFALFLRYHLATCERQDLIGYSNHTLDILRKNGAGE